MPQLGVGRGAEELALPPSVQPGLRDLAGAGSSISWANAAGCSRSDGGSPAERLRWLPGGPVLGRVSLPYHASGAEQGTAPDFDSSWAQRILLLEWQQRQLRPEQVHISEVAGDTAMPIGLEKFRGLQRGAPATRNPLK